MTQENYSIEWKTKPLVSVCRLASGYGFPNQYQGELDGDLPFIKVSDMSLPRNERYIVTANNYISSDFARSLGWKPFPRGSIVFAKVGAALKLNKRRILTQPTLIDNNMMAAIPSSELDTRFLFHFLTSIDFASFAQEGALPSVNQKQIESIALPDISETEQCQIAEVLDAVDAAIQRTDTLINKLKWMKAGLLNDLLTRGLDRDGKLRDPVRHPEQFKDSLLGLIPKDWEVTELGKVVPRAEYGISSSLNDGKGIPVLRMNNLKDGEVDLSDLKFSTSITATKLLLCPLDVLFNRTNSMEHVGRTGIWRGQLERATFASYLVRLVPDETRIISEYLNAWLNLPSVQLRIKRYATPSVQQANINPTNLRKVWLSLPKDTEEQKAVVKYIAMHNTSIQAEEANRNKLIQIKKGLMHDLLTGCVRVPATKAEVVAV